MKKLTALIFIITLLTLLPGCTAEPVYKSYDHDQIVILVGDKVTLELNNIPAGKSAEDYAWSTDHNNAEVDEHGILTALAGGWCSVHAQLNIDNVVYHEIFDMVIFTPDEFKMEHDSYVFALDDGLRGVMVSRTKANLPSDEPVQWYSSDPSIASVTSDDIKNKRGREAYANIQPNNPGTVTITASAGIVQAECTVTIITAREFESQTALDSNTVLLYLAERADYRIKNFNGTVFVGCDDIGVSVLPDGIAGRGGKYMVIVDMGTIDTSFTTVHNFETASRPDSGFLDETLNDGSGFTSLLPPYMRASTIDDVGYIIRVTDGVPLFYGNYDHGVKGYQRVFEIWVEDALTGEVLEVLASVAGKDLASYYYVPDNPDEIPEALYGRLPENWVMLDAIYQTLAKFWLDDYQSVVFYRGKATTRYYGTGEIEIPSIFGIEQMYYNDQGALLIDRFIVPNGIEIQHNQRWKNATFEVEPDSKAEEYCEKYDIQYEYKE